MKKKAFPFCLWLWVLGGMLGTLPLEAGEYVYDQGQSRVSFALKHFRIITVKGRFEAFSGSFWFDPGVVEQSFVDIRIKTASVESGNRMRDRDLCSDKFFWAEKHPEIHFVSREFKETGGMNFDILGELTIRGITRTVVFKTVFISEPKDADAGRPLRFHAETYIKRKDFELGTGKGFNPILFITDELLKISLEVTGRPESL